MEEFIDLEKEFSNYIDDVIYADESVINNFRDNVLIPKFLDCFSNEIKLYIKGTHLCDLDFLDKLFVGIMEKGYSIEDFNSVVEIIPMDNQMDIFHTLDNMKNTSNKLRNKKMMIFNIAKEFSKTPGVRYKFQCEYSGEEFRDDYLIPMLVHCICKDKKLVLLMDGVYGYPPTFLDEAFGGLIRRGFSLNDVNKTIELICIECHRYVDSINSYMEEAQDIFNPNNLKVFNISKEFSEIPGGRYKNEGKYSGEELRDDYLIPMLNNLDNSLLLIDLDGGYGYANTFLEEVFGGLIRKGFTKEFIIKNILIDSCEEPYLTDYIDEYIGVNEKIKSRENKKIREKRNGKK